MTEKTREQLKAEIKEEMLKEELKKEIEQEEAGAKVQAEIEAIREEIRVLREEDADAEKRKKQADRMADYKRIHKQLKELLDRANTPEEKKMIQELITENVNRVMSNGKALLIFIVLVVVVVGGVWGISRWAEEEQKRNEEKYFSYGQCMRNMREMHPDKQSKQKRICDRMLENLKKAE